MEVSYDHETGLWFYEVDELNIIGTGCLSKGDAQRYAQDAIAFTLEDGASPF